MSQQTCKAHLVMLLQTGYHDHTNPFIFRLDLQKVEQNCPNYACFTKALINSPQFNSYRYRDMQKLQSTIAADLVDMVPKDSDQLPW